MHPLLNLPSVKSNPFNLTENKQTNYVIKCKILASCVFHPISKEHSSTFL